MSSLSLSILDFFFFAFKFQTSDVTDDYADDTATVRLALLDLLQDFAHSYFGDPEESL